MTGVYSLETVVVPMSAPSSSSAVLGPKQETNNANNPSASSTGAAGSRKKRPASAPKRWTWKKPKDKPKRPLSAYNLFFASERRRIIETPRDEDLCPTGVPSSTAVDRVGNDESNGGGEGPTATTTSTNKTKKRPHRKTHGKIGFADLARSIAERWKNLDDETRAPFVQQATIEKERYSKEMKRWELAQEIKRGREKQAVLEKMIENKKRREADQVENLSSNGVETMSDDLETSSSSSCHQGTKSSSAMPALPDTLKSSAKMAIVGASLPTPALPLLPTVPASLFDDIDDAMGLGDDDFVTMPSSLGGAGVVAAGGASNVPSSSSAQDIMNDALFGGTNKMTGPPPLPVPSSLPPLPMPSSALPVMPPTASTEQQQQQLARRMDLFRQTHANLAAGVTARRMSLLGQAQQQQQQAYDGASWRTSMSLGGEAPSQQQQGGSNLLLDGRLFEVNASIEDSLDRILQTNNDGSSGGALLSASSLYPYNDALPITPDLGSELPPPPTTMGGGELPSASTMEGLNGSILQDVMSSIEAMESKMTCDLAVLPPPTEFDLVGAFLRGPAA